MQSARIKLRNFNELSTALHKISKYWRFLTILRKKVILDACY